MASGRDQDTPEYAKKTYLSLYREKIYDYLVRWVLVFADGASVRLNRFPRADADPEKHDHPFDFKSLIIWGWYEEEIADPLGVDCPSCGREAGHVCVGSEPRPGGPYVPDPCQDRVLLAARPGGPTLTRRYGWLSVNRKKADVPHRLSKVAPGGAWTIMWAEPPYRDWGFITSTGWMWWRKFESIKST